MIDMGFFEDALGMFGIFDMLAGLGSMLILFLLVVVVAFYVVTAFKWLFIGRKAGLDKDWMPFVPFARTVYKLRIVDEEWWKMFFFDGWWLYAWLLFTIVDAISNGEWRTFGTILATLYLLAALAYNMYWRFKFYIAHRIKPHVSLTILVPFLAGVRVTLDYLIAFTKSYPFTGEGTSRAIMDVVNVPQHRDEHGNIVPLTVAAKPMDNPYPYGVPPTQLQGRPAGPAPAMATPAGGAGGSITGMSGMYAGQTLPLAPGDEMIVGRDNAFSNLIVDQNADKVSRKHCGITYDATRGVYMVTDYSTNGTFIDGGSRLVANMPSTLQRGTIIALGNRENRFKLN